MHTLDTIRLRGPLVSRTLTAAKADARIDSTSLLVGFDTEWAVASGALLSVQFAVLVEGKPVGRVYQAPSAQLTSELLFKLLRRFLDDIDVMPTMVKGQRRVVLVSHFAQAEIGMFADPLRELVIRQVGKAHHAELAPIVDDDGTLWRVRILDLFAFFPASLKKIGKSVGLEKLDEDPLRLEALMHEQRARFDAYALRDAEIAVLAFATFREKIRDDWNIDPLTKMTLPSVAGDVFRRRFLTIDPMPSKPLLASDRRHRIVELRLFAGDERVRLMAARAYWGGRVEAFVRGLVVGPLVERDVVSLYPHAAILQPLPHRKTRWRQVNDMRAVALLEGFGLFDFSFPPSCAHPCLPVVFEGVTRLTFPRKGQSACTFAEARAAAALGATIRVREAHGFEPTETERNHDVARFMRHFLEEKAEATKGTLEYETAKLLLNSLVGKFGQHKCASGLIGFEHDLRQRGSSVGGAVTREVRDLVRPTPDLGPLFAIEWAALIVGRARALMAEIVARGALLVSTDSIICPTDLDVSCGALSALESVDSGLPVQYAADAVFIARSRLYALLRRPGALGPDERPLASDDAWAVTRVARHGTSETEVQFAETVLACLREGRDVAVPRTRTRLLSAESAIRKGKGINAEALEERTTMFKWDGKRRLVDRDVNPFRGASTTRPYDSIGKLHGAEHQRKVCVGDARRRRRRRSPAQEERVLDLLRAGQAVREVARLTGVPRSSVSDLRKRLREDDNSAISPLAVRTSSSG